MTYEGKCPHCGSIVRGGHGTPIKRIGSPFQKCWCCKQTYIDENMYEWAVLPSEDKFYFIFFANNRYAVYLLSLIFLFSPYWFVALICCAFWSIICYLNFASGYEEEKALSHKRCQNPEYIDALIKNCEKVDKEKCEKYKQEFEDLNTKKTE